MDKAKKSKAEFRARLNALPYQDYKNGRRGQRVRLYGDYLYAQDRELYEHDYREWRAGRLTI